MSQKTSATAIGAFVLGAIALLIVALLTFGSGKFLKDTKTYVLYFQGNAKGLNIGAPASFRGVKIGAVTDFSSCSTYPQTKSMSPSSWRSTITRSKFSKVNWA